jgi:hypothetical protein
MVPPYAQVWARLYESGKVVLVYSTTQKNAKMIYISCHVVCTRPAIQLLGSAYFQQYRIMEKGNESQLAHMDPHKQNIRDLQIFMLEYIEQGFTVNLAMDGN